MWAYYANNHRGYCIEYKFDEEQKKSVFPVSYDLYRYEAISIISNIINEEVDVIVNNPTLSAKDRIELVSNKTSISNDLIFLSIAAKNISWEHEKEYRIISSAKNDYFQASPSKIYIGMNCEERYCQRLYDIVKKLNKEGNNISLIKMKFDSKSKDFSLQEQILI